MAPKLTQNETLLRCLYSIQPEGMKVRRWLLEANVNTSFFTDLKKGTNPGVYYVERLVNVAGFDLSAFWAMVEAAREDTPPTD
jgi:hypothetical protein